MSLVGKRHRHPKLGALWLKHWIAKRRLHPDVLAIALDNTLARIA
jgi:hypothetical protein